jgi:imidazolonepropionase-like amidohydrolase
MKNLPAVLAVIFMLSYGLAAQNSGAPPDWGSFRYTILMAGKKAGYETSTRMGDGLALYYEFNDRGRGPKINERIILDKSTGLPTSIEESGVDYLKAPVEEHFSIKEGKATWSNRAEHGEKEVAGRAFYVTTNGASGELAVLTRALRASGGKLALLPAGEVTMEKRGGLLSITVEGKSRQVMQYAITGLGFTPTPVWLDRSGMFFASVSSWYSVILEGWESTAETLLKTQNDYDNQRSAQLAKSLAHKPAGPLAIMHASLFDTETASVRPHTTVIVTGNKITAVGADDKVQIPEGAEKIDAVGETLMPGLWDMHVHLQTNDGLMHMAAGVTSVRDMGNDMDALEAMQARFDDGTEIGPRVLKAGLLDGRGPFAGPTKIFADSEAEARKNIDLFAKHGYVQIKIYSSIKPELVPEIAKMAHSHGMRVSGHVPAFMNAEQFVKDGADEIQHMNFLFLNFMPEVKDTRTPARFTEVASKAAGIDLNSAQVRGFIQLLKEHKTVIDPTLNVFEGMFTDRPGEMSASYAAAADRLPPQVRRGFLYGGLQVPSGMDKTYRDSFQQMLKMTKLLYDAGVPIVAGTDSYAGFGLERELELYQQAGIPAPQVLQLDTLGAARVMKRDSELGSIAPGKLADMILVDGDPASQVSDLRKVKTVVKDGVVYQTKALDQALGVKP